MITGFNTNVRHRNLLFHVQTEDSGRAHPHIISHVYSGGSIMASEKRDYSERVDEEDLDRQVRVLMEAQHKSMISRLEQGDFDRVIAERVPGFHPSNSQGLAQTSPVTETPIPEEFAEPVAPEPARPPPARDPATTRERPATADSARPFGEGIVSQKPLDEVILEYLLEKARPPRRG